MTNTKKVLSIALASALAFGSMGAAFAAVPADVKGTDYEKSVDRLSALSILKGYEDGTFKADKTITRAEFAAVVVRALGYEASAKAAMGASMYKDIPTGNWATGYVNVASGLKIINGVGNGNFAPDAPVKYEEAITMLVRALGYEPAAKDKGGYPSGYMVVAGEQKLNNNVAVMFGMPANRGNVAKLVNNALETPLMIQVGYGSQSKYVVSGTEGSTKQTLLENKLSLSIKEDVVASVNKTDKKIMVGTKELMVDDGFNYEGVKNAKIKAYYNSDNKLISYELLDTVMFDGAVTKMDGTTKTIKLVGANKTYTVDAALTIPATETKYAYAKVVIRDGKVVALDKIQTFDGNVNVATVNGMVINGHGDELNLKDYTIMKDGMEIKASDIKAGDMVFYRNDTVNSIKFAEVYNKSITGNIEQLYTDTVVIAGKEYAFVGASYLDASGNKASSDLSTKLLDNKGKAATMMLNRQGNIVLANLNLTSAQSSKVVGMLKDGVKKYSNKLKDYYTFDLINKDGAVVTYDVEVKPELIAGSEMVDTTTSKVYFDKNANAAMDTGEAILGMVELSLDKDGKLTEIKQLTKASITNIKSTDMYAAGNRINSDVLVFDEERYLVTSEAKDMKISTWAKPSFDKIIAGDAYILDGYVKYILATDTDKASTDFTTSKVVVTEIKKLADANELRIKAVVNGVEQIYYTDSNGKVKFGADLALDMTHAAALIGKVVSIDVDKTSGKIVNAALSADAETGLTSIAVNVGNKEITDTVSGVSTVYRLVPEAKVYEVAAGVVTEKSLADVVLANYTNIKLVMDAPGSTFVKYVLLNK